MKTFYGKEKCRILKQIRAEIAKQNDIEWVVSECKHQGDCRGTCPTCEYEVRQLEAALARREALGKAVAVVGISAGLALSVTGCEKLWDIGGKERVDGMYPAYEETDAPAATEAESATETCVVLGGKPMELPESETVPETETETETDNDH